MADRICKCGINLTKEYGAWCDICPDCATINITIIDNQEDYDKLNIKWG